MIALSCRRCVRNLGAKLDTRANHAYLKTLYCHITSYCCVCHACECYTWTRRRTSADERLHGRAKFLQVRTPAERAGQHWLTERPSDVELSAAWRLCSRFRRCALVVSGAENRAAQFNNHRQESHVTSVICQLCGDVFASLMTSAFCYVSAVYRCRSNSILTLSSCEYATYPLSNQVRCVLSLFCRSWHVFSFTHSKLRRQSLQT